MQPDHIVLKLPRHLNNSTNNSRPIPTHRNILFDKEKDTWV